MRRAEEGRGGPSDYDLRFACVLFSGVCLKTGLLEAGYGPRQGSRRTASRAGTGLGTQDCKHWRAAQDAGQRLAQDSLYEYRYEGCPIPTGSVPQPMFTYCCRIVSTQMMKMMMRTTV